MNTFDRILISFSIDTSFAGVLLLLLVPLQKLSSDLRILIAFIIYYGIFLFTYLFGKGQTFGKRTQKLVVIWNTKELVPKEIKIPNRFYLMLREAVKCTLILITFGFYIIVGGIISTNRQDGRTIHDFIFRTRVVALTKYVNDGVELNRSESVSKSLEGYGTNDYK